MSQLHEIALTYLKSVGPAVGRTMVSYLGGAEEVFKASKPKLLKVPGVGEKTVSQMDCREALHQAEKELKFIEKNELTPLFFTDSRYPKRLKNCNDAPVLLYAKGYTDLNLARVISIVGSRNATEYGKYLCRQLVQELTGYNVLIVSGLALGIDVTAHRECIKCDIPTVGVLGHGLDRLYPAANRATAEKMLENGAWLSEYPSGTIPGHNNFPQRNRIVAGMADATVVIEASIKGGALITAEIANSYNRDVFAFPGRVGDDYSEGCNFLIRHNKAQLLTSPADLAWSLGWEKTEQSQPVNQQISLPLDLSSEEQIIFDILRQSASSIAIDDLTIKTNLPTSLLAMSLLNMEIQGYVRTLPGKMYVLSR
jgi:DNA processing protein